MRREIKAPTAGSVWSHVASVDQRVAVGSLLLVIEIMKTEYPIETPVGGIVKFLKPCGATVEVDDVIAIVDEVT